MIVTINGLCEKNKGDGWIFEPPIFYPFIRAIELLYRWGKRGAVLPNIIYGLHNSYFYKKKGAMTCDHCRYLI